MITRSRVAESLTQLLLYPIRAGIWAYGDKRMQSVSIRGLLR